MAKNLTTYETICLTKVDMPEEKFAALVDRAKAAIANEGKGEFLYSDDWGKAKIAYPIGKDTRARWTYFRFRALADGVNELNRGLSINEFVLRSQTCKTREDGSDFDSYRANMVKDLSERGEKRDFREDRPFRGPRRDYGDRGGDRGGDFGGDEDTRDQE
jgi:small subunit ribosomal protein S6